MTITSDRKNKIGSIVRAVQVVSRLSPPRPEFKKSDTLYNDMVAKYYNRIREASEKGQFLAAHTVFFPSEILYAMDIVPMHTEMTTWMTAMFWANRPKLLNAGAELGLAPEICSPHRGLAGAFHIKALPTPDVMLWSNLICDNTAKSGELVMKLTKCPGFFLDRPFQQSKEEVDYFVGELKQLISFLEEQCTQEDELGPACLRMWHEWTSRLNSCRISASCARQFPSPFPFQGFLKLLSADYMYPGQPEAIAFLEALREDLSEMVKNHKGAVSKERFRLMTLFIPPLYLMGFLEKISQEYGAVSVVEPLFCSLA